MKTCTDCGELKEFSDFDKNHRYLDGYKNQCKKCMRVKALNRMRTKKGVCMGIYDNQKQTSKKRGHKPPEYTKNEFIAFMLDKKEFHRIYDIWVKNGYKREDIPSCDRLDDFKGYTFDNIRVVSWGENLQHQSDDMKNAKGKCGMICKPIS